MVKPWLWLPPKLAHDLSPLYLKLRGKFRPYKTHTWKPLTWKEIEFTNPLGIAGGVDKNADNVEAWWTCGPGFIEVGTVTPKPQFSHDGPIMGRNIGAQAIWNRMGFPNKGLEYVASRLKEIYQPHFTPIFVNIGKNRATPLEEASSDYGRCMERLTGVADAFVINISSPNTQGLRDLLKPDQFKNFLNPVLEANRGLKDRTITGEPTPVLVKLSPDMSTEQLEDVLITGTELGVDGWVLTNTTTTEEAGKDFPTGGGISGLPLRQKSMGILSQTIDILGERRGEQLIVSCGGVLTPKDVLERLNMGAHLVQVYSALIFSGPGFFNQVADKVEN